MNYGVLIKIGTLALGLVLVSSGPLAADEPASPKRDTRSQPAPSDRPVVYTNRDLPPALPSSTRVAGDARPDDEAPPTVSPLTYATYTDRNGRDERWWRQAMAEHRAAVAEAEEELQRSHWLIRWMRLRNTDRTTPWVREADIQLAREWHREAQRRFDALEEQGAALMEEARTSGALPGWFRPG